jgi:large subunit ribosomal protein L29
MLKVKELVNQPENELEAQYEQLSRDIFILQNELKMSKKLEKPHELSQKKKDRARVLTALNQKRLTCQEQCQ